MGKRNRRRHTLSAGTVVMLLLTFLVVFAMAFFFMQIVGEDMNAEEIAAAFSVRQIEAGNETPQPAAQTKKAAAEATPLPTIAAHGVIAAVTPTPRPEKATITIAAAGTVYAPKAVRETARIAADRYDFTPVFEPVAEILSDADLTIATLETLTAGSEKGFGNYNAPEQILTALRACGVDLLSLGTERALDKGYDGLSITLQAVTGVGLSYAGVHEEKERAGEATMMRIGGVQVAVLAYSYGLSEEGAAQTDGDAQGVVALLEMERLRSEIAAARADGANLVIVLPHWGTKNKQETPESVRAMAQEIAQAGADVILGTHPNVPQGIERLRVKRADGLYYDTVVCYSLGSLLTDARGEENTASMAIRLQVTYDPAIRRVALGKVETTPLYIARTEVDDADVYRVVPAQDEAALSKLIAKEQEAARRAAQIVLEATQEEKR